MKKAVLIIVIIINSLSLFSQEIKSLEDSANYYYNKAEYQQALDFYNKIIKQKYTSAELFLNTGNCFYQQGDLANSIYYYEKALKLDPSNNEIQHNLKIANSKIQDKVEVLPLVFYKRWYNSILLSLNTDSWSILSISLFILSLILAGLYLFSKNIRIRKTGFIIGIISLSLSIICLVFSINLSNRLTNNDFAIVFDKSLVKSSPNEEGTNLFEVNKGLKVEVTDSLNMYYNIKLADGKQGWILAENIKKI